MVDKTLMELVGFVIVLLLVNIFFMYREFKLLISDDKYMGPFSQFTVMEVPSSSLIIQQIVYIMSIAGISGAIVSTIFLLVIVKPVYNGMFEDVFLKIGANRNMWGKKNTE